MNQTSMSIKGQVVIPKTLRDALNIQPSDKLQVYVENNKVVMQPIPKLGDVYGMFEPKGYITKDKIKKAKKQHLHNKINK